MHTKTEQAARTSKYKLEPAKFGSPVSSAALLAVLCVLLVSNPADPCRCAGAIQNFRAIVPVLGSDVDFRQDYSFTLGSYVDSIILPTYHNLHVVANPITYDSGATYHYGVASCETWQRWSDSSIHPATSVNISFVINVNGVVVYSASGAATRLPEDQFGWILNLPGFIINGSGGSGDAEWFTDAIPILLDSDLVTASTSFSATYPSGGTVIGGLYHASNPLFQSAHIVAQ